MNCRSFPICDAPPRLPSRASRSLAVLLLVLTSLGCSALAAAPASADAESSLHNLAAGVQLDRELRAGEAIVLPLDLALDSYLRLEIAERDCNVGVHLVGTPFTWEPDLNTHPWESFVVSAVVGAGSEAAIEITSAASCDGGLRLHVLELRPAVPTDGPRAEAARTAEEVLRQLDATTAASLLPRLQRARDAAERLLALGDDALASEALITVALLWKEARWMPPEELRAAGVSGDPLRHHRETLDEALQVARRSGHAAGEAQALILSALALGDRESPEAVERLEQAVTLADRSGDADLQARAYNQLGKVYLPLQRFAEARDLFEASMSHYRRTGNRRMEALVGVNRALAYQYLGDTQVGCQAAAEALEVARLHPVLLSLANCLRRTGRIDAAMIHFQEALRITEAEGNQQATGNILLHLGSLLAELGEFSRAEATLNLAAPLLSRAQEQASLEVHLGWIGVAQGDPEKGLGHFRNVQDRWSDAASTARFVDDAREGIGYALRMLDRPREAAAGLERLLTEKRDLGEPVPSNALAELGRARLEMGDLGGAEEALQEALRATSPEAPGFRGAIYSSLARLAARQDRLDLALAHVEQAVQLRESIRSLVAPALLRASFLARWRDDYGLWADLLVRRSFRQPAAAAREDLERAFEISERAHARTLRELLLNADQDVAEPEASREERRRLIDRAARLNKELIQDPDGPRSPQLRLAIHEAELRLSELDWQRRRPFADRPEPKPRTVGEIQAHLGVDQALLEYMLGEETSYLFVLTRDGLRVHPLPGVEEIAGAVAQIRGDLERPDRSRWPALLRTSRDLYTTLLGPAQAELAAKRQLVIVPDRELFYLPFEILLEELPRPLRSSADLEDLYALSRWDISYVPSANVLIQLQASSPRHGSTGRLLLAFADSRGDSNPAVQGSLAQRSAGDSWSPLPGARDEVREIVSLLPASQVEAYFGPDATADRIVSGQPVAARWMHFAVHGNTVPEQPASSGLVMADRELSARDISDLDLEAELAVLSACQSGLGKEVWGEELIGLSRAFFYAGVPSVIVSLWQVSDSSTAALMKSLYSELLRGAPAVEALTTAKRSLIEDERWRHPYYWAPFVVLGRPGSPRQVTFEAANRPIR